MLRLLFGPVPLEVLSPPIRRHRMPAVLRPSPVLKLFGSGILSSIFCTHPLASMAGRSVSRPNRLIDRRSPVAAGGRTGLPKASTVGARPAAFWF